MSSLITFGKESLTFESEKLLKDKFEVELIPIPIYIELNYFNGIAPCGFGLVIEDRDFKDISEVLLNEDIIIEHKININKI